MQLTGQQVQQIRGALLAAYTTRESLAMMVRVQLNEYLEAIADGENLRVLVFNLVSWAERTGRVDELIQGAYNETPGNDALQQLVQWWRSLSRGDATAGRRVGAEVDALHSGPASIDVFLSYSRKDIDTMVQVREALRAAGLFVWTDEGLEPGTPNWKNAISEAVGQAKAFVVLLSPNAKESVWVSNEIGYAQTFGKPIFPVLVAGDSKSAVPIDLITAQWVDGRTKLRGAVTAELLPYLTRKIAPVPTTPAEPKPIISPPPSEPPSSPPRTPYLGFLLTAVATLVVGFLAYYLVEYNPLQPPTTPVQVAANVTPQASTATPQLAPTSTPHPAPTSPPTFAPTANWTPFPVAGSGRTNAKDGAEYVYVPAGAFTMGSTEAQISDNFELCQQASKNRMPP